MRSSSWKMRTSIKPSLGPFGDGCNTGQRCVASKRFIVVEKVADQFFNRFKASLKPGDPMDPATTLGPLSSEGALKELLKQAELRWQKVRPWF